MKPNTSSNVIALSIASTTLSAKHSQYKPKQPGLLTPFIKNLLLFWLLTIGTLLTIALGLHILMKGI